jgi:hypothetical protein
MDYKGKSERAKERCIHCGGAFVDKAQDPLSRSDDHVFPTSWFPDSTPTTVQRWTVPSHLKCNNDLGVLEKDIFIRLSFCTDPRTIEASGLSKKALAALGIGVSGLSPKELKHRLALRAKLFKQISSRQGDSVILPGLGPHVGFPKESQFSIEIPQHGLLEVAKKIVRGCEYKMGEGRIVDPPYEVSVYLAEESEVPDVLQMLAPLGSVTLGPGFQIQRGAAQDDTQSSIYRVAIWNRWKFFGAILPSDPM